MVGVVTSKGINCVITRRDRILFALLALIGAYLVTRGLVAAPGYTDVFYHLNAANCIAIGKGLTDSYLWTYIGAPSSLPAPSHLYWMPLTSIIAGLGMSLLNQPGYYPAAQWPFTLMFAGLVYLGFYLGEKLGRTRRHAWIAGLLTLFSGYYIRFWGAIDTFAPYALVGALCLLFMGLAVSAQSSTRRTALYFILAGIFAGLAHLTRADGILLLLVGWLVVIWPLVFHGKAGRAQARDLIGGGLLMTVAYLLTMLPWFIRNLNAIGTLLPLGGTQSIWFTEYNDLFNYPPAASPAVLFANGLNIFLSSRWEALTNNLGTLVAVEGLIIMTPLMLVGVWQRRHDDFLRGFWIYALSLHLAMTLVFPFPGYRGGLLHSAAALVPWWAALGIVGLDACVDWIARRRRRWNPKSAKWIFSVALVVLAAFLSISIALPNRVREHDMPGLDQTLLQLLPPGSRVMINDPAQLYYYTGFGGTVLPNESPDVIPEIARQYDVGYLVIEGISPDGYASEAASPKLWSILTAAPDFLIPIPINIPDVKLYEIRH